MLRGKHLTYILIIFSIMLAGFGLMGESRAAINQQINYQGKLTDSNGLAVSDGNNCLKFRIMDDAVAGAELWAEEWDLATSYATTTSGLFSVLLGSHTALSSVNFNQTVFLEAQYDPDCDDVYEEVFSPRKKIGAVPAAFVADKLDDFDSSSFLRSDTSDTMATTSASTVLTVTQSGTGNIIDFQDGSNTVFTILDGGNVGVGTSTPSSEFDVYGNLLMDGTDRYINFGNATGTTGYGIRDNAGAMQYKISGGSWTNIGSGGGGSNWQFSGANALTPTSTVGIILNASSTILHNLTVGTSTDQTPALFVDSQHDRVGISSSTPAYNLGVSGTLGVSGSTSFRGITYTWPSADGSASTLLTTNGSGALSWSATSSLHIALTDTIGLLPEAQLDITSAPSTNYVLKWDGSRMDWTATSSLHMNLSDLIGKLATGQISDSDFGDWTCSAGVCTLDTGAVADNEIDYTNVTLADFTNDVGFLKELANRQLGELTDVSTSTPASLGNILKYNGSAWAPAATSTLTLALTDAIGVLPTTKGGTNLTSYSANQIFYASDSSTMAQMATSSLHISIDDLIDGSTYKKLTATKEAYIDQDVTSGSSPTFDNANITGNVSVYTNDAGYLTNDIQNWQFSTASAITPTTTVGVILNASSTILHNLTVGTSTDQTPALFVHSGAGLIGIGDGSPDARLDVREDRTNGTIVQLSYETATTLTGAVTGIDLDLSTNVTSGAQNLTAINVELPSTGTGSQTFLQFLEGSTTLYDFDKTTAQFNLPASFNSAGDVSMAYDLLFSNNSAAYIKFAGPGYIQTASPSGNYDLTLSAANWGDVIVSDSFVVTATTTIDTDTFFVDATRDRVGIGTTTPQTTLEIFDRSGQTILTITATSTAIQDPTLAFRKSGIDEWKLYMDDSDSDKFVIATTSAILTFDQSGKLGLATSTPNALLTIYGGSQTNTPLFRVSTSTTEALFVDSSGNVGVGMTSPQSKLTIASSSDFAIGDFSAQVIDDMEDTPVENWTSSDSTNAATSTNSDIAKVDYRSLKIAAISTSEDDTVKKQYASAQDWSPYERLGFWIYANQLATSTATTSQIISVQLYSDNNAIYSTHNIYIQKANDWQYEEWNIDNVQNTTSVDDILFRVDVRNAAINFYIDDIRLYDNNERTGEFFVDVDGNLVIMGRGGIELGRAEGSNSAPAIKIESAVVELNQPLSVNTGGDVGFDYDLVFMNTGVSQITSEGSLRISAGDSNSSENLTLTTGNTGDIVVELANNGQIFKVNQAANATGSSAFIINSEANATTTPSNGIFRIITDVNSDENTVFVVKPDGSLHMDGYLGVGTTGPDRRADFLDSASAQLRLTQADGSQYVEFQADAAGDLTITPSGDAITIPDDNFYVCAGDACPALVTLTGTGNLQVENDLFVGGNLALGNASSTSVKFTGYKLAGATSTEITGISGKNPVVRRVRVYIEDDPGVNATSTLCRLSFYSSTTTEDNLITAFYFTLTYTELNGARLANDTGLTVDSTTGLVKYDLVRLLDGTAENQRITGSVTSTTGVVVTALDGGHADDQGVVRVAEITEMFQLFDNDGDALNEIHAKLETFEDAFDIMIDIVVELDIQ